MRKLKTLLSAVAAVLIAGAIAAYAGNTTFFTSIGDIVFPLKAPGINGTGGYIGDQTRGGMAPVNGINSYTKTPAASGFSYIFGDWQREMLFDPSGTLLAGYVTMAPTPVDGHPACVFSTAAITNFYWTANTGQSINDAVTALVANTRYCYTYSKSNTTWDRSQ